MNAITTSTNFGVSTQSQFLGRKKTVINTPDENIFFDPGGKRDFRALRTGPASKGLDC